MINPKEAQEKAAGTVRKLLWVYFWLLLLEGALRKWIVPQLSNPLLVIRDPFVLAIYYYALRAHVFPRNGWTISLLILGALSTVATAASYAPGSKKASRSRSTATASSIAPGAASASPRACHSVV